MNTKDKKSLERDEVAQIQSWECLEHVQAKRHTLISHWHFKLYVGITQQFYG